MKQTLKLQSPPRTSAHRTAPAESGRGAIEISLGSAEGLRIVRRRQPEIVWRKSIRADAINS